MQVSSRAVTGRLFEVLDVLHERVGREQLVATLLAFVAGHVLVGLLGGFSGLVAELGRFELVEAAALSNKVGPILVELFRDF